MKLRLLNRGGNTRVVDENDNIIEGIYKVEMIIDANKDKKLIKLYMYPHDIDVDIQTHDVSIIVDNKRYKLNK